MNFRDKLSQMSKKNINTENDFQQDRLHLTKTKLDDSSYRKDEINDFVFDLTNPGNMDNRFNGQSNQETNMPVLDLTQNVQQEEGTPSFDLSQYEQQEDVVNLDIFSDPNSMSQTDLEGIFNLSAESKGDMIIKSTKVVKPEKKKTRQEIIDEYVNGNINFWWRLNALYIRPENEDETINYATLTEIKDPLRIDFQKLKKVNYKFYSAIEDSLNELKDKYEKLVDEIKKSNIFAGMIDEDNVKLEDIDIPKLRSVLVHKYDTKLRNFLKSFNPYSKVLKNGIVEQEPKDLLGLKTEFEIDVVYDVLGQSAIFPFLKNKDISEIMVIGPYKVYIEYQGKLVKTKVAYSTDDPLRRYAREIASLIDRPLDSVNLSVDARLPDGSRFHGIIPPVARFGTTLTIRKFSDEKLTLENLIEFGSISTNMAEFVKSAVASKLNIIVAGGTGSGKTTMLNICSNYIGHNERTITVEDSAELQLIQDHVVSLETKESKDSSRGKSYTIRQLVKECLRMRPDRIICGECRGGEAWDMLVAMNTGHEGSMTTIHANNPVDTVKRVANMVAQVSGDGVPMRVIFEQIASSVDLIIYQSRLIDGSRKTTYISELRGYNVVTQSVEVVDLYRFIITGEDSEGRLIGEYRWTGNLPSSEMIYKVHSKGYKFPDEIEEAIESKKSKHEASLTLEEEFDVVDNLEIETRLKERIKLALDILRQKESENELEIIEQLEVPLSLKNKMKRLLMEDKEKTAQQAMGI